MSEYARFHELRRYISEADFSGLCDVVTCHKNKEQLSKWLQSQTNSQLLPCFVSFQNIGFCSFEHSIQAPFSSILIEIQKCVGDAITRLITYLVVQKESNPELYGDVFQYKYENAYGMHSYDYSAISAEYNEILVSVNSHAPDDFIDSFNHRFVVNNKYYSSFLSLVPMGCFAIGVAILAKNQKMIQIHVGVSLKNTTNVRIITNESKSSQFDKIMAVNAIIDKAGL